MKILEIISGVACGLGIIIYFFKNGFSGIIDVILDYRVLFFAVVGGIIGGIIYFFKNIFSGIIDVIPDCKVLDELMHQTIIFGFLWLTLGIITGAVWANDAWGTYWSWDPKETWSLITWFVYATALHARFVRGWAGRRIAYISIIGFVSVMFTYFGVNFLLSGLHSYDHNNDSAEKTRSAAHNNK